MRFLRFYVELTHNIVISAIEVTYLSDPRPGILSQWMICHSVNPDEDYLVCLSAGNAHDIEKHHTRSSKQLRMMRTPFKSRDMILGWSKGET